jgi:hypothetical protein
MHLHIGLAEFAVFALYYIILKAVIQLINIETRRNGWTIPAAVSGLFA